MEKKEIPTGNPLEEPIRKTALVDEHGNRISTTYEYPNGYTSTAPQMDPEWRKKKPVPPKPPPAPPAPQRYSSFGRPPEFNVLTPEEPRGLKLGIDAYNFSGLPRSSGLTSGSVITKQF